MGSCSFNLRDAHTEPNITSHEFAELIQPMLLSALAGSARSGQELTLALYFNATRWFVSIEVYVPICQRKPKAEFHAREVRPASNNVIEWELTFAKQFLKSYRRVLNDWTRDNVKSLIEPAVRPAAMAQIIATCCDRPHGTRQRK